MRRLGIACLALLVGCASTVQITEHALNPQKLALGPGQAEPEAPPVAVLIVVKKTGLIVELANENGVPELTLGNKYVVVTAARGTTQGDIIDLDDTLSVDIIDGTVVTTGSKASITPADVP